MISLTKLGSVFSVFLLGSLLMATAQHVQSLSEERAYLQEKIRTENEKIAVLKAEWAYLNRPERLETLMRQWSNYKAGNENNGVDENFEDVPMKSHIYSSLLHESLHRPIFVARSVAQMPVSPMIEPSVKPFNGRHTLLPEITLTEQKSDEKTLVQESRQIKEIKGHDIKSLDILVSAWGSQPMSSGVYEE